MAAARSRRGTGVPSPSVVLGTVATRLSVSLSVVGRGTRFPTEDLPTVRSRRVRQDLRGARPRAEGQSAAAPRGGRDRVPSGAGPARQPVASHCCWMRFMPESQRSGSAARAR
ncbi:hypothetical protein GCM10010261_51600 [Streptomyces pilosus]|uniref:Uncharacterized protein n=1 Tax=Streptomyces pilosus TaxID=28893 RepID=A0A918F2A5_9ACTN|nr:hypothetical protein GCM10010280_52490 [Streptomyces pilosus]GGV62222.1 hypothetical protein GCM10010261_51600 [Streptomyces pilosus]